jgi:hypothetical protein
MSLAKGTFEQKLAFGQAAESDIAKWLRGRGHYLLPIYDIEIACGKGPRIFGPNSEQIVAPDFLVRHGTAGYTCWLEAKHKTVFTWHRKTCQWTTGIDLHHYQNYIKAREVFAVRVMLMFLHSVSTPSAGDIHHGCPAACPTGLYGGWLDDLRKCESHRHHNHGRYGMVYWAEPKLTKYDTLDNVGGDYA